MNDEEKWQEIDRIRTRLEYELPAAEREALSLGRPHEIMTNILNMEHLRSVGLDLCHKLEDREAVGICVTEVNEAYGSGFETVRSYIDHQIARWKGKY